MDVRAVTVADATAWASLRHRLWPDASLEELAEQVRAFFDEGTQLMETAFIAWDGDDPAGFIELSVRAYVPGADSLPAPFVEGWFVKPARRGQGVGRSLVQAAEDWARSRGFTQLGSDTLMENGTAAKAHEALGFRTVEMIRSFIKDLNAPG